MPPQVFRFNFYVDGDEFKGFKYTDYLANRKLMALVTDRTRRRLLLGRTIYSYDHDYLKAHKDVYEKFMWLHEDSRMNKLKYFAPNSLEQERFINDWDEHDVIGLVAPNRVGKTTCGVVKALLSGIIPTDPTWPIFTEHGIKHRPFMGGDFPMTFGMGSYEWSHIKSVVWPRVKEYLPDFELGVYGQTYWKGKNGKPRTSPNFDRMPHIELGSGTRLKMHAYSQSQANYESDAYNGFMYDEQPPENIFNAVDERTRTLKGYHFFTLTPHKVEGRSDTGGGGWLQRLFTGEEKNGHSISCYNTSLGDVPDWIYPESEKVKAFEKWIHEPTRTKNTLVLREGRSRVLGEWHKTSGLVIDNWDMEVHIVDDFKLPVDATLYRGLDHGVNNPTACLWAAVTKPDKEWDSEIFIYREMYTTGKLINENVSEIIRLSGNSRRRMSDFSDNRSGMQMQMWEEVFNSEKYAASVLDSRSFASSDSNTGKPYGWIYKSCGLPVKPASGKNHTHWVPIMKSLFHVDYSKNHPYSKGVKGRSKIYIFRSCVNLIREINGWIYEEYRSGFEGKNMKETPRKKDDHGCTALVYLAQIPLRFRGDLFVATNKEERADYDYANSEAGYYRGI
jgi:phage terminase large subunit-like protein